MNQLKAKTFNSAIIVMISSVTIRVLTFASIIVLARLLEPKDFGTISLIGAVIASMNLFSGLGMRPALIASKESYSVTGYHGFIVTLVTGTFLTLIIYIYSENFANIFGQPDIAPICRWLSLCILLNNLFLIPDAILSKEMLFGKRAIANIIGMVCNVVCAISLAFLGYGVWSLAFAQILEAFIKLIFGVYFCPSYDWLKLQNVNIGVFKSMLKFGLNSTLSGIFTYIYNHVDKILLGKVYNTTVLGFYSQARKVARFPVRTISRVSNSVLFPAYTKMRHDKPRLKNAYLKSYILVSAITVPLATGIFSLSNEFIVILLGEKWIETIPILKVLCVLMLIRPISGTTSSLFLSLNLPQFNARTSFIQAASMVIFTLILVNYGAVYVAIGLTTAFTLGFFNNIYLATKKTGINLKGPEFIKSIIPILLSSFVMFIAVVFVRSVLINYKINTYNLLVFFGLITIGIVVYLLVLLVTEIKIAIEMAQLFVNATKLNKKYKNMPVVIKKLEKYGLLRRVKINHYKKISGYLKNRFVKSKKKPIIEGPPEGLTLKDINHLLRIHSSASTIAVSHQHLSSWKQEGTYRVYFKCNSKSFTFIFKNSNYNKHKIVALKNLPILPGLSEYTFLKNMNNELTFIPKIFSMNELVPNEHYTYIYEDLGKDYFKNKGHKFITNFVKNIPEIHDQLNSKLNHDLNSKIIRYDRKFSEKLLVYAENNLVNLKDKDNYKWNIVNDIIENWREIEIIYRRGIENIYENKEAIGLIHGDLNRTNILCNRNDNSQIKLLDWEWVGIGVKHSDLVSFLKNIPDKLEKEAVKKYIQKGNKRNFKEDTITYQWCKMQRGLFDASFFARESCEYKKKPIMNMEKHIERAINRTLEAVKELKQYWS